MSGNSGYRIDTTVILGNGWIPKRTIAKNIRNIFQDKSGVMWFATNDQGLFRYDYHTLKQYTTKNGLPNNQVLNIAQDVEGNIWLSTGEFGVCRLKNDTVTVFASSKHQSLKKINDWNQLPDDLWFCAANGAFRWRGKELVYLPFPEAEISSQDEKTSHFRLGSFAVYSVLKDRKNNVWFGTQAQGVCCFNGSTHTWFKEKGLAGSAVLALFEDRKGNVWFGNNGSGLFCYNGMRLSNITSEHGLDNREFKISGDANLNSLARIYAINEDDEGNIWIGTVDAGVWKFSGREFTHFLPGNGLATNAVNSIVKDKTGQLWFGTDANGIYKYNGSGFKEFIY